jgi:hypothetical protein
MRTRVHFNKIYFIGYGGHAYFLTNKYRMRKNKKALTFIAVFLGVLVLYCLMNHSEGFNMDPAERIKAQMAAHQGRSKIDSVAQDSARMAARRAPIDSVARDNARMAARRGL